MVTCMLQFYREDPVNQTVYARRVCLVTMETITLRVSAGLLLFVIAVAPWAVAFSPSSSSGSASGDMQTELECKAPPYSNPSGIRVNPTDQEWQELMLEGRCYLACATDKYQVDYTINFARVRSQSGDIDAPQL